MEAVTQADTNLSTEDNYVVQKKTKSIDDPAISSSSSLTTPTSLQFMVIYLNKLRQTPLIIANYVISLTRNPLGNGSQRSAIIFGAE